MERYLARHREQKERKKKGAFHFKWKPSCRIVCVNVGTTDRKWDEILQLIGEHKLDVLMMQETRTTWNEMQGITAKMRMEGWGVFISDAEYSSNGARISGMMTIHEKSAIQSG